MQVWINFIGLILFRIVWRFLSFKRACVLYIMYNGWYLSVRDWFVNCLESRSLFCGVQTYVAGSIYIISGRPLSLFYLLHGFFGRLMIYMVSTQTFVAKRAFFWGLETLLSLCGEIPEK